MGRTTLNMSKSKKERHPTLFVLDGTIRCYEDGSMLELNAQITQEEWEIIVEETIRYKVFVECLKSTGCPSLGEPWSEEDDWFRLQLDVAVSRMRNIDPLLVSSHNQEKLTAVFSEKMSKNAAEVQALVEKMRAEKKAAILEKLDNGANGDATAVSNL